MIKIRDYKDTYKKMGSKDFLMFYLGEYNMLRHEVYRKWAVPGIMLLLLVADIGYIYDKALWVIGAIGSLRAIVDIKEIDNLKVYFEMAKLTEQEKEVESAAEKIWME